MNGQTKLVFDELSKNEIQSVLNIGFRHDSDTTIRDLVRSNSGKFSVLEAYGPNCEDMRINNTADTVYELDVRSIDTINDEWDAIIWLHGPEHVHWNEFLEIRRHIESKANKIVIYQAPIGEYPQGELYNNPYEKHLETLTPSHFLDLGYEVVLHDGSLVHEYDFLHGEFTFSAIHRKKSH